MSKSTALKRGTHTQILALILGFLSISFFCFGLLFGSSFVFYGVEIEGIDTSLFTPDVTILMGCCMWIPATVTGVAAWWVWYRLGRSTLQINVAQAETTVSQLQEYIVQSYLDEVGQEVLGPLTAQKKQKIESKTIEISSLITGLQKRQIIQYLYDLELIGGQNRISLNRVNLQQAELQRLNLSGVDFTGADLQNADLTGSILRGAKLTASQKHALKSSANAVFTESEIA